VFVTVNVITIFNLKHVLERKTGTSLSLPDTASAASDNSQTTTDTAEINMATATTADKVRNNSVSFKIEFSDSALGGGVLPKDLDRGCVARLWKPLPCFRPKYVIFPTLFQT